MLKRISLLLLVSVFVCFCALTSFAKEAQTGEKTQGEFAVQVCKALGYDVPEGNYIAQLEAHGIMPEGGWQKDKTMSSTEMAGILAKALGLEKEIEARVDKKVEEAYRDKATIIKFAGAVSVKIGDMADWAPAQEGMKLTQNDYVKTGPASWADLRIGVVGGVKIRENSEVKLSELTSNTDGSENIILYMTIGEMLVDVRGLQKGSNFQVNTVTTVAAVRGTIYNVKVSGEKTEVNEAEAK